MGKTEKCTFVAIVLYDIEIQSTSKLVNSRDHDHLHIATLAKGHLSVVCHHFQRTSSFKLLGQFQSNFKYSF